MSETPATHSGTFLLGGERPVHRLGFGAMRLTGKGIWGEPRDRTQALAVLRRTRELGIVLIDTADSYGPEVSERLIAEALYPYPRDLVIATKAGFQRPGPDCTGSIPPCRSRTSSGRSACCSRRARSAGSASPRCR